MTPMSTVSQTLVEGYPVIRGKVRDVYDLGDKVLLVATDRISAFDYILPNPVPDKGRVLTGLTAFWMNYLQRETGLEHGLISTNLSASECVAFAALISSTDPISTLSAFAHLKVDSTLYYLVIHSY